MKNPSKAWLALALSVWMTSESLALPFVMGNQPVNTTDKTDWYTLKANGHSVGEVEIRQYQPAHGEAVTEISNINRFKRDGNPFEVSATTRFVENPADGKPLNFTYQYQLGNQELVAANGELRGDRLDVRMLRNSEAVEAQAPVSQEQFVFPGGPAIQKVYRDHINDTPGSRFQFQTINLGVTPQVVETEATLMGQELLALADGSEKQLSKFELKNPSNHASTMYEWRDAQGKLYKAQSVHDGTEMVYTAQREVRGADFDSLDLVTASAVITNAIPQPRATTEALYRIAPLTGHTVDVASNFPESTMQRIVEASTAGAKPSDANTLYLKVSQKEPDDVSVPYPILYDRNYLQSTPYLQATDAAIERTAIDVVGPETRAYYAARKLQQWVYRNIRTKSLSLGFASAKETLLSREGDCTEHAVLLAALARSVGIPSRVAVGLIYLPQADQNLGRFVYHMWTEVYIGGRDRGEWIPLDATNPEPVVDATHIKMLDSPLNDENDLMQLTQRASGVMGHIRIDTLKALSPTQSILSVGKQPGVLNVELPKIDLEQMDIRLLSKKSIKHYRVKLPPETFSMDSADGLFTYGVEQLSKDNYAGAVDAFKKAMAKLRRPVEFYRMGEQLASIEMYGLARQAFERARQSDSAFGALTESWLNAYLPDETLSESLNREFMHALNLQIDKQNTMGAATVLQRLAAQAPRFAPAYVHLGQVSSGADAIEAMNAAIAIAPNDFKTHEGLGDALLEQRRYGDAVNAYRRAVDVLTAQSFAQGKAWLDDLNGKMKVANGAALLAKNKHSAAGSLEMAKGLLLQGRVDEAKSAVQNALRVQPGLTEARVLRFEIALRASDWDTLSQHKAEMVAASGGSATAARLLGRYYIRTRQYPEALALLQKTTVALPGNPDGYMALSQVYERMAQQKENTASSGKQTTDTTGLHRQAETALQRGLSRMTNAWDQQVLSLKLAELLLEHGKASEALPLAERVLALNPTNSRGYLFKGQALLHRGDFAAARETLEVARFLNPNDVDVLTQSGHVAMEEGRESLGLDYYQKAYKADAGHIEAALALRNAMIRLNTPGKKPPAYWDLSDDEKDYLIQLCYLRSHMIEHYTDTFRQLVGIYRTSVADKPYFSISVLDSFRQARPLLDREYNYKLSYYHWLNSQHVPARFQKLQYAVKGLVLADMKGTAFMLETLRYRSDNDAKRDALLYAEVKKGQAEASNLTLREFAALTFVFPISSLDEALAESKASRTAALAAEQKTLAEELEMLTFRQQEKQKKEAAEKEEKKQKAGAAQPGQKPAANTPTQKAQMPAR